MDSRTTVFDVKTIRQELILLTLNEIMDSLENVGYNAQAYNLITAYYNLNEEQINWLNRIINERITVRELEKMIKNRKSEEAPTIKMNPAMEDVIKNSDDIKKDIVTPVSTNQNRFFNVLESEATNMNFTEEQSEEIEMLDILDIPSKNDKYQDTIDEVRQFLSKLNEKNNNIIVSELDLDGELHLNIIIKEN